jgi:predicted DNA-binding protein
MVRARVSKKMKQQLEALANERGEAEAVLVREAIRLYVESQTVGASEREPVKQIEPGNQ